MESQSIVPVTSSRIFKERQATCPGREFHILSINQLSCLLSTRLRCVLCERFDSANFSNAAVGARLSAYRLASSSYRKTTLGNAGQRWATPGVGGDGVHGRVPLATWTSNPGARQWVP